LSSPKGYSFGIPYSYYKKVQIVGTESLHKLQPMMPTMIE
jgi:hypothetical protein